MDFTRCGESVQEAFSLLKILVEDVVELAKSIATLVMSVMVLAKSIKPEL